MINFVINNNKIVTLNTIYNFSNVGFGKFLCQKPQGFNIRHIAEGKFHIFSISISSVKFDLNEYSVIKNKLNEKLGNLTREYNTINTEREKVNFELNSRRKNLIDTKNKIDVLVESDGSGNVFSKTYI